MDLRADTTTMTAKSDDYGKETEMLRKLRNCLQTELLEATPTSRKEAMCWVYDSMSARTEKYDIRSKFTHRLLDELVPSDEVFSRALLLYFCECGSANSIVDLMTPTEWRKFFVSEDEASSSGILKSFFGNFRYDGDHLKGAKALQQYALRRREKVWNHLRWKKKSQSPIVCATKPGTFCELDVEKTLQGPFGEEECGFWSSKDFVTCLRESAKETIMINCAYFVNLLFMRLRFSSNELRGALYSFLMQQRHVYNCQRILPVIRKETDVLKLANVLFESNYEDVDDLCLATALSFRARLFANALSENIVLRLLSHDITKINAPTKLARLCQYFVVRMKLTRGVLDVEEVMERSDIKFDRVMIEGKLKKKRKRKKKAECASAENNKPSWRIDGEPMMISVKSDLVDRILERYIA